MNNKTKYLICKDINNLSNKIKQAKEKNIENIIYDYFKDNYINLI